MAAQEFDDDTPQPVSWQGFRISSQDLHGHSTRMWVRVQPAVARQVGSIVQLQAWPYRDTGDLMRHALDRHLHWLEGLAPIPSITHQVDAINALLAENEFSTEFALVFERMQKQISNYIGIEAEGEARGLVLAIRQYVADMPDGGWKRRYLKEIEERFGHLVAGTGRGISLSQYETDEGEEIRRLNAGVND